jgi:hypothetical protein
MSSMRNWNRFHSPGDKLSTFTRSEPVDANEKATDVKRAMPRARTRKKVRLTGRDAAEAMRGMKGGC